MLQKLCLMPSHGGLILHQQLAMVDTITKGCQPLMPSLELKPKIIKFQSSSLRLNPCEESRMTQKEWFNSNRFVNVDLSALSPMIIDVQARFGIVEECTKHDKNLQYITFDTTEPEIAGVHKDSLSDLMNLQLPGIVEPQRPLPRLIYPDSKFYISKSLLDIFQDSTFSSKVTVHPDGQITFLGTEIEMKNLLAIVAESYLSEHTHKGEKRPMLVPHFSRLNINEVEARSYSSASDIHSTLTVPLKSPGKVKGKPSQKKNKKVARERDLFKKNYLHACKNKKVARERDLFKKNYLHACESLLSLMVDKRHQRKTAIISLKKSGPELPELLTQFSVGIAGTGLAVLLSVICKLACGRVSFCASKLFNTGFGFGLVWLSWGVNKLRDTIANTSKNAGKIGLKDEEIIQKVDKSLKDVHFRAVALLVVAVLRLA